MESRLTLQDDEPEVNNEKSSPDREKDGLRVKVALRIRRLIQRDLIEKYQIAIQPEMASNTIKVGDKKRFQFDKVFDMEIDQKKIYDEIAGKLIDSFFNGYNGTIMAYGQTGSGKTFTMGNSMEAKEEIKGIIPRTIDEVAATYQVFRRIEELQSQFIFIVRATYVEIYNEEIYDLLASNGAQKFARNKSHALSMKEEKDGSIVICGVTEEKIDDKEMLYLLLEQGNRRRSVGSTAMNDESSRSHAIFTIIIEKNSVSDEKDFVCARFSFVDLAGSERLGRTEAVGKSMKEGININKGLLALGNVISALTDDTGKVTFIPYRVSKLTRILRNSLGGNSRTWMIACVSPVLADLDESLNTIKYATRARKIANTPIVNKDPQSAIITQLKQQIFKLQSDLSKMKRIIHQNGLVGQLNELEDDLTEETGSIPGPSKEKDRILSRRETTLDIETMGDTDYRLKQAEKEILKLKEQRDTVKKDLNEKNILYLKIIGRVAELRNQNQQLSDALEKSLAKLRGEAIEGVVEVAAAVLATSLKKDSNDEVISLVREVENLRLKLAEKSKYSSTLEDEYTKLLKISTKENELLVEKVREISELQRQLKKHERASISRDSNNYDIPLLTTKSNLTEGGSGLEDSNFAVDASTTQDQIVEEKDTEVYFKEKEENELEIKKLMENLVEKEAQLRSMMEIDRDEEMMEIEMLTEKEVASLDRLTDLEQQLMELQKERDDALKKATQDSTGNLRQSFEGDKHMDFLKKTARKNSEAFVNKEAEIVGKYKVKVSLLEQQIHEMKKKDNDSKQFDSKLKEKNEKIDLLMGEINKMKTQKIDLDKKLREGSQSLAKSKLEKQKEILNVKKELFKKSAEINRLKNLTRKQDLSFHKKLSELKKSGGALHFTKKNTKKVTSSTFEDIDLEGFSQLMTVFCQKIFEHVELESELEAQTNTLAKYHTKLDELFEEISRLEVQRQLSSEEEIQEEIGLIEEKQKEFEASMSSCEDTIKIKKSYIARMEADLEYLREFIDEGFASLLTFLSQDATNKEAFWEAALNVMMVELEGLKRTQVGGCASVKQAEADVAGFKKNFNDNRNAISNLEQEVERLKKLLEEKDQLLAAKEQNEDNNKHKFEEETPVSNITDSSSKFHLKTVPKPELAEGRSRASTNLTSVKSFHLDVLRNKLMNTEIQKDGALKMAETYRDKYIKMQDLISNMIDIKQAPLPPPAEIAKKDKFIKPHKRHAIGPNVVKQSLHSHNASIHLEHGDLSSSPNTHPNRRRPKETADAVNTGHVSRENSRKRRSTNMSTLSQSFQGLQGKLNFPIELQPMDDNFNLYSKELQKRKIHTILSDLPAVGLFEVGSYLIADFKKELICYDITANFETVFKRDFAPGIGRVVGCNKADANTIYTTLKGERSVQIWDLREAKVVQSFKCGLEEIKGVEVIDNMLYVYGKSYQDGGACNFFDIGMLNMLCPAEKNQDIMTMTRRGNVIYNGCRNHYIRRIRVNAMQSMTPLDPPHYDTISGFSWMAGNLVSASKDRVLKLWEVGKKDKKPTLINQVFNASKDYIKVVRENHDETLMFTADDAGEIKFWELNDLKLECIGGVTPSTEAILSADWLHSLDNTLACSSADKLITLYKISDPKEEFR